MKVQNFTCAEELEQLLTAFETGGLNPGQFPHAAHLAVALFYLDKHSLPKATRIMRSQLQAFLQQHGVKGYHETLTVFWMQVLAHLLKGQPADIPLWQKINQIQSTHGNKSTVEKHYSAELLSSPQARDNWIPPDREPLPGEWEAELIGKEKS